MTHSGPKGSERRTLWQLAVGYSKDFTAMLALASIVWIGAQSIFGESVRDFIKWQLDLTEKPTGGSCLSIPQSGHKAYDAKIGKWAVLQWNGIHRLRHDCGKPVIHGWVSNGRGIMHSVDLSIDGIALPIGIHNIAYRFRLTEGVLPGRSRIRIVVSFPEAVGGAPTVLSPWVPFEIID